MCRSRPSFSSCFRSVLLRNRDPAKDNGILPYRLTGTVSAFHLAVRLKNWCECPLPALRVGNDLTNAFGCVRHGNAVISMICGRLHQQNTRGKQRRLRAPATKLVSPNARAQSAGVRLLAARPCRIWLGTCGAIWLGCDPLGLVRVRLLLEALDVGQGMQPAGPAPGGHSQLERSEAASHPVGCSGHLWSVHATMIVRQTPANLNAAVDIILAVRARDPGTGCHDRVPHWRDRCGEGCGTRRGPSRPPLQGSWESPGIVRSVAGRLDPG